MKAISIRFKIFLYLIGTFSLILLFVIFSPRFFFQQYYTYQKINTLVDQTENFATRYLNKNLSSIVIFDAMRHFTQNNDAYITIQSGDPFGTYSSNYRLELTTDNGSIISLYVNDLIRYDSESLLNTLRYGDNLTISGYWLDDNTLVPRVINNTLIGQLFFEDTAELFETTPYGYIQGTLTRINMPVKADGELYRSIMAYRIQKASLNYTFVKENFKLYEFSDPETGMINYMIESTYEPYTVIALIALPSTSDVDQYIASYMQFAVLLGLFSIIVFGYIISRMITKPLHRINESARLISELDFSKKIPITSKDELGTLSRYLNTMSKALETTLLELNEANNTLQVKLWRQKELEDMRKQFIADVSHEVKTPLGIVQGYAERVVMQLLQEDYDKNYIIDCATIIIEEAQKMNHLIINMNELSRLESPAYTLSKTHFELKDLVEEVVEAFDIFLEEKHLSVKLNFDRLKCYIYADRAKLEQVLINFMSNVIRYTPEYGAVNIHVDHRQSSIYFAMENEADSISENELHHLWERFYRGDKSRSRELGGSGIGLSIVKVILELHGYTFGVESTELGIQFYFYAN